MQGFFSLSGRGRFSSRGENFDGQTLKKPGRFTGERRFVWNQVLYHLEPRPPSGGGRMGRQIRLSG